ncbi:hypothetical protein FDO65_20715 [Nakamurella flava]|uniref:Uncharacterized protein n=1 Tax=Nakamurella flava TaxID=2576308 RepID=A0A4U6Q928_9ACTN|nr:hypothetical protein [Nakamurella flava]TKV56383.1 hypothetical protein FDO65_20715 [Nakamurella flava]
MQSRREGMGAVSVSWWSFVRAAALVLTAVLLTEACTSQDTAPATATSSAPTTGTPPDDVAADPWGAPVLIREPVPFGPERYCGGLAHTETGFALLSPSDVVTGITVCGVAEAALPGDGIWAVVTEHRVPDDQLPSLVEALRQRNFEAPQPPGSGCAAYAVLVPMFTVTTADGRLSQGAVPSDGCHPQMPAVDILRSVVSEQPVVDRWRTVFVKNELWLTRGCPAFAATLRQLHPTQPDLTTEALTRRRTQLAMAAASPDGASVCLYGPSGPIESRGTELAAAVAEAGSAKRRATGRVDATVLDRFLTGIVVTTPEGLDDCELSHPWPPEQEGTYLQMSAAATTEPGGPGASTPFLFVEVGACGRVLDGDHQPVGWADRTLVAEIRSTLG